MRLIPRSLHMRMVLLSGVATLLALLITGWAIAGVLERFVIGGLDRRLDSQIALMASAIKKDGQIDKALLEQRLGAFDAGPGWRWRIVAPDVELGSANFPDMSAGPPGPPPPLTPQADLPASARARLRPLEGVSEDGAPVHARTLTLQTGRGPATLTAAAPREVVSRPIRGALAPLLASLAILAAVLVTAALVQLRVGLRPIRQLRDQVAAIRSGARECVDEAQASELQPLALELNALAKDNARMLVAARQSAANLAHALKTPVATLALGVRGQPGNSAQVERIDAIIRHHLGRARAHAVHRRSSTALAPAIADLVEAVRQIHGGRALAIDARIDADLAVAIDVHDVQELIGNLLDNAASHARGRIQVGAGRDPADRRRILITITDDGDGIPESERSRMVLPGVRLDEQGGGHGFGLSIVSELATLYGGALTLAAGPEGGLAATLSLPAAITPE